MTESILAILPEILMLIFALFLIIIDLISSQENKSSVGYFGIAFIIFVLLFSIPSKAPILGFNNMVIWDNFSYMFFLIFAIAYILTVLSSVNYAFRKIPSVGEYYLIAFISIIGMMFMASALDLSIFSIIVGRIGIGRECWY